MSILTSGSLRCFSIFQRSMIQANQLRLCEVLDSSLFAEAFQEDKVVFGIADEDVFTPAITLWAMISQFLFKQEGRSCKAAAGRVVSLIAQVAGRVVAQNAGNYCRAKAKIPITTIKKIALRLASQAEIGCLKFDDLTTVLDSDQAEERLSPRVIAEIRSLPIGGRIITSEMTTRSVRSESVIPNATSNGRVGRVRSGCRKKSIDARLNSLRYD